ncbi:hypothetical protein BY996DRAFT_6414142 [Phakopsora pachyrhizi]|nr:hypothetical protein BY996DRAFT_6414142 [Phakopsora pachyrhizi]
MNLSIDKNNKIHQSATTSLVLDSTSNSLISQISNSNSNSSSLRLPTNCNNRHRSNSSSIDLRLPPPFPSPSGTFLPPPIQQPGEADWRLPVCFEQFKRSSAISKPTRRSCREQRSSRTEEEGDDDELSEREKLLRRASINGDIPTAQKIRRPLSAYQHHQHPSNSMLLTTNTNTNSSNSPKGENEQGVDDKMFNLRRSSAPNSTPCSEKPARPLSNSNEALLNSNAQSQQAIRLLKRLSSSNRSTSTSSTSSSSSNNRVDQQHSSKSVNNYHHLRNSTSSFSSSSSTSIKKSNPQISSSDRVSDGTKQDFSGGDIKIRDFGFQASDPRHVGKDLENQANKNTQRHPKGPGALEEGEEQEDDGEDDDFFVKRLQEEGPIPNQLPSSLEEEEEEGVENVNGNDLVTGRVQGDLFVSIYDFKAEGESEMDLVEGEFVRVLEVICDGWVVAQKVRGQTVEESESEESDGDGDNNNEEKSKKQDGSESRRNRRIVVKFVEDEAFDGCTGLCPENYLLKV